MAPRQSLNAKMMLQSLDDHVLKCEILLSQFDQYDLAKLSTAELSEFKILLQDNNALKELDELKKLSLPPKYPFATTTEVLDFYHAILANIIDNQPKNTPRNTY